MRFALLAIVIGCSSPPAPTTAEGKLRARLGVPEDARTVVIFQQAAHLDLDWQHTFDEYYSLYVNDVFSEANDLMSKQSREHYSVTEMGFLKHHLEMHPELPALERRQARVLRTRRVARRVLAGEDVADGLENEIHVGSSVSGRRILKRRAPGPRTSSVRGIDAAPSWPGTE